MQEQKEFWRYGVTVFGVKKRCRRPDTHSVISLGDEVKTPTEDEAKRRAQNWIANNMKSVERAVAMAYRWRETKEGFIETQPFNDGWRIGWKLC